MVHCVHHTYTVLKLFELAVCFTHFSFFEIFTAVMRNVLTIAKSLNHYFQHGAHCAHHIESVLKLFEIAVCFAKFRFLEIYTAVVRTVLTMANKV